MLSKKGIRTSSYVNKKMKDDQRMKLYTTNYFIKEVQQFYKLTGRYPKIGEFKWSVVACQRFGSWDELLREAGLLKTNKETTIDNLYELEEKKDQLWKEIVRIIQDTDWYEDEKKRKNVTKLREGLDEVSRRLGR